MKSSVNYDQLYEIYGSDLTIDQLYEIYGSDLTIGDRAREPGDQFEVHGEQYHAEMTDTTHET
jgi:hypothetical protein